MARETERRQSRLGSLLELAEDRLITKEEFSARCSQLESERAHLRADLGRLETEIGARLSSMIDVDATLRGLQRLGHVLDEPEDVRDRRRLISTCLNRVVVQESGLELHVPAYPLLLDHAAQPETETFSRGVADSVEGPNGYRARIRTVQPSIESAEDQENYGNSERRGVPAGTLGIVSGLAPARRRSSRAPNAAVMKTALAKATRR